MSLEALQKVNRYKTAKVLEHSLKHHRFLKNLFFWNSLEQVFVRIHIINGSEIFVI